jgi:hypothetical protein
MLVDPSGQIQTELDETEGIAFGEVGRLGSLAHSEVVSTDADLQRLTLSTRLGAVFRYQFRGG